MIIDTTQTKIEHELQLQITLKNEQLVQAANDKHRHIDDGGCSCHIHPPCDYCASHCYCEICDETIHNDNIMEIKDYLVCEDCMIIRLTEEFEKQYPDLPIGGFYNPIVWCQDNNDIEFSCCYDNYDNEEDGWTWYYDKETGNFYH